jgi:autotransporter-associated beta strand protein
MRKTTLPIIIIPIGAWLAMPGLVHAAELAWDTDPLTAGAQGGAGDWATTANTNWWDGAANASWVNNANAAIFGGIGGTVNLIGTGSGGANVPFQARAESPGGYALTFTADGYLLQSNTVNVNRDLVLGQNNTNDNGNLLVDIPGAGVARIGFDSGSEIRRVRLALNSQIRTIDIREDDALFIRNGIFGAGAGANGPGGIRKIGSGTLALQDNANYTGGVALEQGTLVVFNKVQSLLNPSATVLDNALTLTSGTMRTDFTGTTAVLTFTNSVNLNGSVTFDGEYDFGFNGAANGGAAAIRITVPEHVVNVAAGRTITFADEIQEAAPGHALTKTGPGTLAISGAHTYTGTTTIAGGRLLASGSLLGNVNATGGSLGIGPEPGSLLIEGNTSLGNNSELHLQIDGDVAGFGHDQIAQFGTFSIGSGVNLSLSLGDGFDPRDVIFTLLANDGVDPIAGFFATVNGGSFGPGNSFQLANDLGTFDFLLYYAGEGTAVSGGNDLVLVGVPEPNAALALAAGGLVLGIRRQRRAEVSKAQ